ncbi:ALF repeat-containing protein [Streptomyces sp. NPDC026206]|uniref:ALF repeat-containing protein n=1 Tax=Streptomyces sp. NPDC026206 TaxID=3157089 RepID=UPI0033E903AB
MAQAQSVEKLARESEKAELDGDTKLAIEEAKDLKKDDQSERNQQRELQKQAGATDEATKQLLTKAAVPETDAKTVVEFGRKAAVNLMDNTGIWTRQAAQDALAGTDDAVATWVKSGYRQAVRQDQREKVLALAKVGGPALAEAAQKTLESRDAERIEKFLAEGAYDVQVEDYRLQVLKLMNGAGRSVVEAGDAALKSGTVKALHTFLVDGYREAQVEDDRFETLKVMHNGGPKVQAAAQVAMAGPAWMQHEFVTRVQHKAAQQDLDTATHVAAVRAMIANAAGDAARANENAALAYEVAKKAQDKAREAGEWADKARAWANEAKGYAAEAQKKAHEADASAASAASSAQKAKAAAATAQQASRQANYSASQATASAEQAAASASSAQSSAASASQSAAAAGKDAAAASAAATEARNIADEKYQAEQIAAAAKAAQEAKENASKGVNPADDPKNDTLDTPGKGSAGGDGKGDPHKDAKAWAKGLSVASAATGIAATYAEKMPFPQAQALGRGLRVTSDVLALGSAVATGMAYGFTSDEFQKSLGKFALGRVFSGINKTYVAAGASGRVAGMMRKGRTLVSDIIKIF